MSFFAQDSFTNGGDLVDLDYWYAGRDKVQHIMCGLFVYQILRLVFGLPVPYLFISVFILGILWEFFEYYNLIKKKPRFADRVSWRDVVADMVGAFLGFLLTTHLF